MVEVGLESFLDHWLPTIAALIALGIWAGRLENVTRQHKQEIEKLWRLYESLETGGSRALGIHLERLNNDEADIKNIDHRTEELTARLNEVERRAAVTSERLRKANERYDRLLSNNHNNNHD